MFLNSLFKIRHIFRDGKAQKYTPTRATVLQPLSVKKAFTQMSKDRFM